MSTKVRKQATRGSIDPDRLYTFEELSAISGLSARRLYRMADEGRLGYVLIGEERGRMIEGQQWLDFKASRRVGPES